jgi:hypothetical protein
VATAGVRLALDATIVAAFVFSVLVLKMFWPSSYLIVLSLGILFCLMCIRVLVMMYLINKNKCE